MAKRRLVFRSGAFHPFDDESKKAISKYSEGSLHELDVKLPRNWMFLKKYYALLNVFKDNVDAELNTEEIDIFVRDKMGFWENILVGDTVFKKYNSISFAKMGEIEFQDFFDRSIDILLDAVPIDKPLLLDEINRFANQ